MSQILVLEDDVFTLWFHPEQKIVHHQIKKFIYGEELHKMLLKGMELMQKHHAQKWLSDDRGNPVLKKEDLEWGQVNWFPQTVKAGWKYWAIVQPKGTIGKATMDALAKQYAQGGVVARFFSDPDEAMQWLESVG